MRLEGGWLLPKVSTMRREGKPCPGAERTRDYPRPRRTPDGEPLREVRAARGPGPASDGRRETQGRSASLSQALIQAEATFSKKETNNKIKII